MNRTLLISAFLVSMAMASSPAFAEPVTKGDFLFGLFGSLTLEMIDEQSDYSIASYSGQIADKRIYTPTPIAEGHLVLAYRGHGGLALNQTVRLSNQMLENFLVGEKGQIVGNDRVRSLSVFVLVPEIYAERILTGGAATSSCSTFLTPNRTESGACEVSDTRAYGEAERTRYVWKPISEAGEVVLDGRTVFFDIVGNLNPSIGQGRVDIVPRARVGFLDVTFPEYAWWDSNWDRKFRYNMTVNISSNLNNALVAVYNYSSASNFKSDCSDIRHVNDTEAFARPFLHDSGCQTGSTVDWVLVNLSSGTFVNRSVGYLYHNNTAASNATNNPSPLNSSWKAFYRFQNDLTNDAVSGSGFTLNWTGTNNAGANNFTDGRYGRGVAPAGARWLRGDLGLDVTSGDFTTIMWVQVNGSHNAWAGFWDFSYGAQQGNVLGFEDTTNKLQWTICGTGAAVGATSLIPADGNFHMIAVVHEGTTARLYLNQTIISQRTGLAACAGGAYARADIFRDSGDDARTNNVKADNFFHLERAMTTDELRTLWNATPSFAATEVEPAAASAPFFGTPENKYQGATEVTGAFTSYDANANFSYNWNVTDPDGDSEIDTVIIQINGTNFSNKGPPVNPGTWHDPNVQVYNKSVGGQFYLNFTPPPAGSYIGFFWSNDTNNDQNQSANFTGTTDIRKVGGTGATFTPASGTITYNATSSESCSNIMNDTVTLNYYRDVGNGDVLVTPAGSFVYPGGTAALSCDIVGLQNYTKPGTSNATVTVNNGTLPVAGLRKFINGLPRNVSASDLVNFTVSANGTTIAGFENVTFDLWAGTRLIDKGTAPSSTIWLGTGTHLIAFNSSGNQNYSAGGNNSIYINVHAGLQDISTSFNTPIFETNWTSFNFSAFINDTANIINVSAYLTWNMTNQSFTSVSNISNSMNFTNNFTVPLYLAANNTDIMHNWTYRVAYRNGTTGTFNTSRSNQTINYAYNFTGLSSDKSIYLQTDVANFSVRGVNKLLNPAVNHTVTINFNGSTFFNTSFSLNATWRGPDFDSNWTFHPIQMPPQTLNNTTIVANASYTVQFGNDRRTTANLGSVTLRIIRSSIGECGSGNFATPVIGFFTYNESTRGNNTNDVSQATINNSIDATFTIYQVTNSSNFYTASFALRNDTNYYICLDVNSSFTVDADIRYEPTSNHPPRHYFLSNATLTSSAVQEIKLFVLHDALADRVNFIVKDSAGTLLPEHIVKLLKYYLDVNLFETVAMFQTDSFGEGNTYLQLNDVFYKMIVEKGAVIKSQYRSQTFKCADTTDCNFNLVVPTDPTLELFEYQNKIGFDCDYDNSTLTLSCTVSDPSGASRQFCLDVKETSFIRPVQTAYTCVSSTATVLGHTFTAFNSSKVFSWQLVALLRDSLQTNETILDSGTLSWGGQPTYGTQGVAVGLLVILAVAIVGFLLSPVAAIVMTLFAAGLMQFMGILTFESDMISSGFAGLVVVGLIIMWFIRRRSD